VISTMLPMLKCALATDIHPELAALTEIDRVNRITARALRALPSVTVYN
jgi:hypothetical protein